MKIWEEAVVVVKGLSPRETKGSGVIIMQSVTHVNCQCYWNWNYLYVPSAPHMTRGVAIIPTIFLSGICQQLDQDIKRYPFRWNFPHKLKHPSIRGRKEPIHTMYFDCGWRRYRKATAERQAGMMPNSGKLLEILMVNSAQNSSM